MTLGITHLGGAWARQGCQISLAEFFLALFSFILQELCYLKLLSFMTPQG